MNQPDTDDLRAVPLRCLGGRGAPSDLIEDARLVASFPKPAQKGFWMLLVPILRERMTPELGEQMTAFADQHGLDPSTLSRALRAHRFLLRQAATHKLDKDGYAADLVAVAGSELAGRRLFEIIMPGYALGCQSVVRERVGAALTAHGALLEQVDWRLDEMVLSTRGPIDRARVGVLTLGFSNGDHRERITLQALPEQLEQLERACRQMLGKPTAEGGQSP